MPRVLHKRHFLAEMEVCSPKAITREVTIIAGNLDPREAKKKALEKMKEVKAAKPETFVSLHTLEAIYYDGKIYRSQKPSHPERITLLHERFHGEAVDLREGWAGPLEESAAYAWESTLKCKDKKEEQNIADQIQTYLVSAKHSVRFMFALDLPEPNTILSTSMGVLRRQANDVIVGDSRAVAFNTAKNFMLYLECLAILRQWGEGDGKKILLEAIECSTKHGLKEARQFLVGRLPEDEIDRLNGIYGVDMTQFRVHSPYSPKAKSEELFW